MSRQRLRSSRRAKRIELSSSPGGPRPAAGRRKLEMDQPNFFGDYDTLIELVRNRVSVRNLKPDPIPDEYVDKILEIGRWAMSGANGQPWEFVVVKDPKIKAELFRVYVEENVDFIYWMEQQRDLKLRHPAYQMTQDAAVEK